MSTSNKSTVILNGTNDWLEWLAVVRTTAKTGLIWEYVDPSKTTVPTLSQPTFPKLSDVNSTVTSVKQLTDGENNELRDLREVYRYDNSQYSKKSIALADLERYIQTSVARQYLYLTFNCDTVHQMLLNLQKRLKPKADVLRLQLLDRYRAL